MSDEFINPEEELTIKKDGVIGEETDDTEDDPLGLGDVEDEYDTLDKDDDPYVEMQSLMNPYDIAETF